MYQIVLGPNDAVGGSMQVVWNDDLTRLHKNHANQTLPNKLTTILLEHFTTLRQQQPQRRNQVNSRETCKIQRDMGNSPEMNATMPHTNLECYVSDMYST
eukprot:972994-Amphidinium_carterae.1